MYLYVPKKDVFDDVPEVLMKQFGKPELVMLIDLNKRPALAGVDKAKLDAAFSEKGFYLQMPPKVESLLAEHRASLGLSPTADKSGDD